MAGCYVLIPRYGSSGRRSLLAAAGLVYLVIRSVLGEKYYKCVNSYKKSVTALILMLAACIVNMFFSESSWVRIGSIVLLMIVLTLLYVKEFIKAVQTGSGDFTRYRGGICVLSGISVDAVKYLLYNVKQFMNEVS